MIDLSTRDLEIILAALVDLRNRLTQDSDAYTVNMTHDEVEEVLVHIEGALND